MNTTETTNFSDIIKSKVLENFSTDISLWKILITMGVAFFIGLFIYLLYKRVFSGVLYSKSFNVSLIGMTLVQIGDTYLERYFDIANGSLYKAEMNGNGGDLVWRDDSMSSYPALSQKSEKADNAALLDMLNVLNNGTDYDSVLDVEEALKYIALNVVTTNTDSYLGQNKQNYYLYEQDGVFSVLPWDYNMAFGGLGSSQLLIDEPTQGAVAERPLIAKLLQVDEYKELYHSYIREAIEGYLANDAFKARVEQLSAMISPYVKQDPRPFNSYDQYESAVSRLISQNASAVSSYAQQLAGTIASSNNGNGSVGGMGGGPGGGGMNRGGQLPDGNAAANGNAMALPAGQAPVVQLAAEPVPNGQQRQNGQMGGGRGQGGGMGGFPGGGGMPGMNGQQTANTDANRTAAIKAAAMLGLLLLASVFVVLFRRRRF